MSLSEASIFFFSCLCRWQKHQFSFFHAYVVDRSNYFLFFMLMSLSEVIIFFFSCLCRCQKHQFSFFHAYVVDKSDYFLHFMLMSLTKAIIFFFFMLMSLTEAIIFSILRLCRWQKRFFSSFRAYVVDRSIGKTFFYLTEWCCSLEFLVSFPSNRKYRFQILFLKSTDRVEAGCDDVSIGMMIE